MNLAGRAYDADLVFSSFRGLGRFLQEDALEGAAALPASQNRYIYCQNDPVALIDPTGYSPENTGTPPRFTLGNIGNHGTAASACLLPDMSKRFSPSSLLWWGDHSPGEGSIYCFNASGDYEVKKLSEDAEGNTYYEVTINGVKVYVTQDAQGNLRASYTHNGKHTEAEKGIVAGLNAAFTQMEKEGIRITPFLTEQFLKSIVSFSRQNLGTFASILRSSDTFWTYFQFMKHATIGKVIADEVKKVPYTGKKDKENNRKYDHSIAFWVSYYDEKMGYNSTLRTYADSLDENGQYTDDTVLGLIDQMRILKAVQYKENGGQDVNLKNRIRNEDCTHHSWDIGLFSVNDYYGPNSWRNPGQYENFIGLDFGGRVGDKDAIWTTNVFANIGAGVGMFYSYQFNRGGKGKKGSFTLGDAIHSIIGYNPNNPLLDTVTTYMNMKKSSLSWIT